MTAVALVNIYEDPHLVSDTMLSYEIDTEEDRKIWVPARGVIQSSQKSGERKWGVSRFIRKAVYLPNQGGIFAWAGSLRQASMFWNALSKKFLMISSYNELAKIEMHHISSSYDELSTSDLSIVGCLLKDGEPIPFVFGDHRVVETNKYGVCYLIGSGMESMMETIRIKDEHIPSRGNDDLMQLISKTEDLAQYISSRMLFLDSMKGGYHEETLPFYHFSGGYFEWHKITPGGVKLAPIHLDINIRYDQNGGFVTRAYLSEAMIVSRQQESKEIAHHHVRYVSLLSSKDVGIDIKDIVDGQLLIKFERPSGVILYQGLLHGDEFRNSDGTRDIWGYFDKEELQHLFGNPINIFRTRTFFIINEDGRDIIRAKSHVAESEEEASHLATVYYKDGLLYLAIAAQMLLP